MFKNYALRALFETASNDFLAGNRARLDSYCSGFDSQRLLVLSPPSFRPQDRTPEDVNLIVSQLQVCECVYVCVCVCAPRSRPSSVQILKVFEGYPEDFLHDLASLACFEEPQQNVTR